MKSQIARFSRIAAPVLLIILLTLAAAAQVKPAEQTPEQLCKCSGDSSARLGGLANYDAFQKRYARRFRTPAESQLAWRVYQAVNRCNAVMVIGRLADTADFEGKSGYCVLRGLSNWTVAINDVFINAGTDRQSGFLLVSQPPIEALGAIDARKVESDRETHWRVIYNHEIAEVESTRRYKLAGEPSTFSPRRPGRFDHKECFDTAGAFSGTLTVREVRGQSNIQPGQTRIANISIEQAGCRAVLKFGTNEIAGYLIPEGPPHLTGVLDEVIAGSLVHAEIMRPPNGPLNLTIEQRSATATIISTGRLNRR